MLGYMKVPVLQARDLLSTLIEGSKGFRFERQVVKLGLSVEIGGNPLLVLRYSSCLPFAQEDGKPKMWRRPAAELKSPSPPCGAAFGRNY